MSLRPSNTPFWLNFYLLAFVLFGFHAGAQKFNRGPSTIAKLPIMHHFSSDDYSGGIQNWDIAQDTRGIIYVANNNGLMEFDGESWRTKEVENGTRMLSLYIDQNNVIYSGGQNQIGYFKADEQGILQYHSLNHLIKEGNPDNVWRVIGHEGKIFFNTDAFIYVYEEGKMSAIKFNQIGVYVFQVARQLFAYSPDKGLLEWNGKGFSAIKNGEAMAGKSVIQILPFSDGLLIFLNEGYIYQYRDGIYSEWKTDLGNFLKQSIINTAELISSNHIAIGTQNNGLIILDQEGHSILNLSKRKGLSSSLVHSIFEDQFHNLWLGLGNGVTYLEWGSPFSIIDERVGVQGTGYSATFFEDNLYLGTNNGLFYQSLNRQAFNSELDPYQLVNGSEGQVYSIEKHGTHLLMGHHNGGFLIQNNKGIPLTNQKGIWRFRSTHNQKYIAGTYTGFLAIDPGGSETKKMGNFSESSRLFEFQNDSVLWMSHGYKGVFRVVFDKGITNILSVKHFDQKSGFPSDILINVFRLGNKLVFPAEYGIYQYNQDQDLFQPDPELESLLGKYEHISYLTIDHHGNIYFLGVRQMGQLARNNFNTYDLQTNQFKSINKYISDDLENITVIDAENILIGAKEGFIHYNPTQIKNIDVEFQPILREVSITHEKDSILYGGGYTATPASQFKISGRVNSIKFEYATPYFDGFKETRYQYKLDNFDADWSEWSFSNEKEYTNLPYGTYTFRIRAKNLYDQEQEGIPVKIQIVAPWYLSRLAYTGYILLVFAFFGVAMFILDSRHRYDKKRMELEQKREILRKDREIESVSTESKAAISTLKNEKLRAEVDHKNKELASSTMHLLSKNEFMLNVKNKLDVLIKGDNVKADELRKIVKTIDKNISEDEDWEQFSVHFDNVHSDFLKKLKAHYPDLTPQETKLAAYLRMNLSSKDIAQLLNISVRGVEISRYRLRKKINLERDTNLVSFMMDL